MGLPSGEITLLFTDIEGSTRLWERSPHSMAVALERHDVLLRQCIETAGGYVFKTVGDAHCAAFDTAGSAVIAVLEAQRALGAEPWPEGIVLRVRMGLHSGTCQERDGDYFGPTANRAARLSATAYGGQVVVSGATAVLAADGLPAGATLRDLGMHRLKDLGQPERVFQLVATGLEPEFPPLRSLDSPRLRHNLPEEVTSFVGRGYELREIRTLFSETRLLTLVGAGGAGKTRLALHVAEEAIGDHQDGVWLVELAPLTEADQVVERVAAIMGVREEPGRPIAETMTDALRDSSTLIVLDNCEHLVDTVAALAALLLRACPGVRLLATSREPLRVQGERIHRVPSLTLPAPDIQSFEELVASEAGQLFVDRAAGHDHTFEPTMRNSRAAASICRRLDGIPLALELAAARLRSLSVTEVEERLDNRFRFLTGGSRTALPRQQTLRALVAWSFELLDETEAHMLRRLSIFAGSFDLDMAEQVCTDGPSDEINALDTLGSLVDKSLVQAERAIDESRYRLLESIRAFAAEQLAASGDEESDRARSSHAAVFLALAEDAAEPLEGPEQPAWLARLDANRDDLRAAMLHEIAESGGADRALRFGIALRRFWQVRGHLGEGLELLDAALAQGNLSAPEARRAAALAAAGDLHQVRGEYAAARARYESGTAIARQLGDACLMADLLAPLSFVAALDGDGAAAVPLANEAVTLARECGDAGRLGWALEKRAVLALVTGGPGARQDLMDALEAFREVGALPGVCISLKHLSSIELEEGNPDTARAHLDTALELASQSRAAGLMHLLYQELGVVLLRQGDAVAAGQSFGSALTMVLDMGNRTGAGHAMLGLALCASASGDPTRGAHLHGLADSIMDSSRTTYEAPESWLREDDRLRLSHDLGPAAFEDAVDEGRRMSPRAVLRDLATSDAPWSSPSDESLKVQTIVDVDGS